jgi:hypothetical protein
MAALARQERDDTQVFVYHVDRMSDRKQRPDGRLDALHDLPSPPAVLPGLSRFYTGFPLADKTGHRRGGLLPDHLQRE